MIRYEDMSIDPYGKISQLFRFLKLPQNRLVAKFIKGHTQTEAKKVPPHSTIRNSTSRIFLWKKQLKSTDVTNIQNVCKAPMRILGYNLMTNLDMNISVDNFHALIKPDKEIWSTDI